MTELVGELGILFLTIPTVTALIGWLTNWAAVKMIFSPEKFVGIGPIGWQGILPRNSRGFAKSVARTLTGNLLSARDLAGRLDPVKMEALFGKGLDQELPGIVRSAAEEFRPGAWERLPEPVRAQILAQLKIEVQKTAKDIFLRLQGVSDEILDLKSLVVRELSGENTGKLVRLFQQIGSRELRFIEYYGGIFGLLIGVVQVFAWSAFQIWWLMPVVGVFTGLVTNYLALHMIFRPLEPISILGVVSVQGLFPKRQAEIAADYGRIAADEIITPENLIRLVAEGEGGQRIAGIVVQAVHEAIDDVHDRGKALLPIAVTEAQIEHVKLTLVTRLAEAVPTLRERATSYLQQKLDIAKTVEGRLAGMPKLEFERILRGLFERDEMLLVIIGGVLGGVVGLLQAALVAASS